MVLANYANLRFATYDLSLEGEGDNDLEGEGDEEGGGGPGAADGRRRLHLRGTG